MRIEIETEDKEFVEELFGMKDYSIGSEIEVQGGAKLRYEGTIQRKGVLPGLPEIIQFSLTFLSGAVSSLIANWLYGRFKNKVKSIRFEHKLIEISNDGIRKVLEEKIDIKS